MWFNFLMTNDAAINETVHTLRLQAAENRRNAVAAKEQGLDRQAAGMIKDAEDREALADRMEKGN